MTNEKTKPSGFARFLLILLRLILIILIGILIGAGLYFGFKYAYNQIATPIQQNQNEIQSLSTRISQQWELIQEKNADLEDRLTLLESDQDILNDQVSEMQTKIEQNAADLEALDLKLKDLVDKSLEIQHKFGKLILSCQHVHLDHNNCLETISVKGKASLLKELADSLISLKGLKHGKLVMSAI